MGIEYVRYGKYLRLEPLKKEFYSQPFKAKFFGTDNFYKIFIFEEILMEIVESQLTFNDFMKVIQKTSKLNHANIIRILDFHDFQECYALIMEYFPHEPLISLMATYYRLQRSIPPMVAVFIATQVCEALDYTHNINVVHGNLSPLNILITHEGLIKIKDFGVFSVLSSETNVKKLNFKQFRYIAPENLSDSGITPTPASDIYSVGVIMYELLTGQAIYSAGSIEELEIQVAKNDYKPILEVAPHVPEELAKIVEQAISHNPEDRFSNALEFKRKIQKFLIQNNKIFSSQHFYSLVGKLFQSQIQEEIEQNKGYEALQLNDYKNALTQPDIHDDEFVPTNVNEDLFDDSEATSILFDNVDDLDSDFKPVQNDLFSEDEKTSILDDEEETDFVSPQVRHQEVQSSQQLKNNFNNSSQKIVQNQRKNQLVSAENTNITENQSFKFEPISFIIGLAGGLLVGIIVALLR
ncbi:serine/threonine protein kinase [bacterium]|nr:serine/threonine protein kinase [bacterium]